ncbi:MAG: hypothetical protein KDJ43_09935 [Rhizobiaceae bacterium]|nr:hypothetical protein [Rhizobiaceae bacterium]
MTMFLVSLLAMTGPTAAQEGPGAQIAVQFARPALNELTQAAEVITREIGDLCASPSAQTLSEARGAFAALVPAWGKAHVLRFGPLLAEHRMERIFFWPDPRGIALKQVQAAIAEQDESAATPAGLSQKSAALQGLPALEFALYGSGSDDLTVAAGAYRCRFAAAIAGNIETIAGEVLAGWDDATGFASSFTGPAEDKEPYRSAAEVNGEIVRALSTQLRFIREAELLPAFGEDADKARGKRAPLWRSELTFTLVAAQLEGLRDLLNAAGYESSLEYETAWVPGSILFEIGTATNAANGVAVPPVDAFGDEEARGKINVASIAIESAAHMVTEKLAAALGLIMGFNALDGD